MITASGPQPRSRRPGSRIGSALALSAALVLAGCAADDRPAGARTVGVDLDDQVLSIGLLNDESGPGAAIGRPYALGKRILAAQVNAGGSGLLPEGWTVRLVERDHAYNPQRSVQAYNEIRDQVLFIGNSFGTPNTLPLQPMLERDRIVALPASLSSKMAEHRYTPPAGTSYRVEAMRAMDWVVESAGGAQAVQAGVVYQQDDYGQDGLDGWREAARHHGVRIVSEQAVAPGQTDMTAVVNTLRTAGASHVLLTTLPSSTGSILGTAAQLGYRPVWIGNTPAWVDRFFDPQVIPAAVFANFHWVQSIPYWGESVPGMDRFLEAFRRHAPAGSTPDFYVLASYLQGMASLEAFRRAIERGDVSRDGYLAAFQTFQGWDAGGMLREAPVDLTRFPYVASARSRILRPVMPQRTWEVAAGYAVPRALATPE